MSESLIGSSEVGVLLGKSTRTVSRMAARGDLPYVRRLPGPLGQYLFDPDRIHQLIRERQAARVSQGTS